jgi:aspartate aminotransferase
MPAIATALEGEQDAVEQMRQQFEQRGHHIHQRLNAIDGITCHHPQGAFYVFPDISAAFGQTDPDGKKLESASDFAASLLAHQQVAVVPGEDFGAPRHVRLSFATSMDQIDQGLDRLQRYLQNLT